MLEKNRMVIFSTVHH